MINTNAVVFYNFAGSYKLLPKSQAYEFQLNYSEAYEIGDQIVFKNGPLKKFLRLNYRPIESYIGNKMKVVLKGTSTSFIVTVLDIIIKNNDLLRPIVDVITTVEASE